MSDEPTAEFPSEIDRQSVDDETEDEEVSGVDEKTTDGTDKSYNGTDVSSDDTSDETVMGEKMGMHGENTGAMSQVSDSTTIPDERPERDHSETTTEAESTDGSGEGPIEVPDSGSGGVLADGLKRNETALAIGMSGMSFALAYGVLLQMTQHGIHHAPVLLWFSFAFLVLLPVGVLYGMGILSQLLNASMNYHRGQEE